MANRENGRKNGKAGGNDTNRKSGNDRKGKRAPSERNAISYGKIKGENDRGNNIQNRDFARTNHRNVENTLANKESLTSLIYGRNSVMEVLSAAEEAKINGKKMPFAIEEVIIQEGATGSTSKIMGKARSQGIKIAIVPKEKIQKVVVSHDSPYAKHQGVLAITSPYRYSDVDDILEVAKKRDEDPFVIILDGIEDPHNLGAIMRTAECAGAHGIIIPNRRSATVNETVIKTSAGATAHIMCAKVSNIVETMKYLQQKGIWITALDMDGDDYTKANFSGPLAIVVGGEDKGVTRLVRENSDFVASIPIKGKVNSLNASNAAAIIIYKVNENRK